MLYIHYVFVVNVDATNKFPSPNHCLHSLFSSSSPALTNYFAFSNNSLLFLLCSPFSEANIFLFPFPAPFFFSVNPPLRKKYFLSLVGNFLDFLYLLSFFWTLYRQCLDDKTLLAISGTFSVTDFKSSKLRPTRPIKTIWD